MSRAVTVDDDACAGCQSVGVATMLILEKQAHLAGRLRERVSPPEGALKPCGKRAFAALQLQACDPHDPHASELSFSALLAVLLYVRAQSATVSSTVELKRSTFLRPSAASGHSSVGLCHEPPLPASVKLTLP